MLCPNCNETLAISVREGVEIDYCPHCRGVWLDRGELDKIIERTSKILSKGKGKSRSRYYGDDDYNERRRTYSDDSYGSYHEKRKRYENRYNDGYYKRRKKKSIVKEIFDIFD